MEISEFHGVDELPDFLYIQVLLIADGERQLLNLADSFVFFFEKLGQEGQITASKVEDEFFEKFQIFHSLNNLLPFMLFDCPMTFAADSE